jgi:hypothetical protein
MKYTIQLNYNASFIAEVLADNEGDALDKARDMAEDADIKQFVISNENESKIIRVD